MNIEPSELAQLFAGLAPTQKATCIAAESPVHGANIVVLDAGFVYQGNVTISGGFVRVANAKNIRVWGTKKGLGQLAIEGPQPETKLDNAGDIAAPIGKLITLIKCQTSNW